MKKIFALFLTAALLLGMIPFAGAAFSDADKITAVYQSAVNYVAEKNVISGFPDGSFKPQDTLTRAQAAKILCVMLEGAEKSDALTKPETGFTDVPASHWAAKYIAYCVDKGIVAGVGGGKFNPNGKLTAAAFGKMLLVAYQVTDEKTLVGEGWAVNTQKALKKEKLNYNAESIGDMPTTRENACCLAYNFLMYDVISKAEPEAYKETTIALTDSGKYRLLGRAQQSADGVICDCSADGVEFTADCKGMIEIRANSSWKGSNDIAYRVIVDGAAADQVKVTAAKTDFNLIGYAYVLPGVHTIRIVKDYEITASVDLLKSVTLTCKPDTVKPTQPKKRMLLVVGDSTSAGFGIIPTDTPSTTKNSASAILTYGYCAAEALDMDYELVVKGTTGAVKKYGNGDQTPCNQRDLYEFQNPYRDPDTHYAFPRKADAAVVKISNNDNSQPPETEEAALRELIANIRKHSGEKTPIVLIYFTSNKHIATADKLVAEDPLITSVLAAWDNHGMGGHASGDSHVIMTERVVGAVKQLLGEK